MPPPISVIIPAYNAEKYLAEAIKSVLKQTFRDFELIIIDDVSTDNTVQVMKQYAHDPRVHLYFEEQNEGEGATRNKGIARASGEYIAWLDADDVCLPTRLEKQLAFMQAHPEISVCGSALQFIGAKHEVFHYYPQDAELRSALLFNSVFANPATMVRRAFYLTHNLFYNSNVFGTDYDMWVRAACLTKFANLSDVLIQYRVHADQVSNTNADKKTFFLRQIWQRQLDALGIIPTEAQWQAHITAALLETKLFNKATLSEVHEWLVTLWQANLIHGVYPQYALSRIMTERWIGLCKQWGRVGLQMLAQTSLSPVGNWKSLGAFAARQIKRRLFK